MTNKTFKITNELLSVAHLAEFVFNRSKFAQVEVTQETFKRVESSYHKFIGLFEKKIPIYGVTTGFGDSCFRFINPERSKELQANLINYLLCGTGPTLPREVSRAILAIRLNSLSRGYSGVSPELIERMRLFLEKDLIPVIPREGSLGASGDLIPLAYIAQALQGQGQIYYKGQTVPTEQVLQELGLPAYELKPKEGLSLVNGTTAMAGFCLYNLKLADYLVELCETATAWTCLALQGRREAFSSFINSVAKTNPGQSQSALKIRDILDGENYQPGRGQDVQVQGNLTKEFVQDRYSLRCVPQILGPIRENLSQSWDHVRHEINSVTDNPLISDEGDLEMGGNFYGGYLCQSMDYTKINLAHLADLIDRQVMLLVDEKSNRGLPPNLIDAEGLSEEERPIHHGLKGVHQATSAITSEILARATPNGIFSRSSESHNQDKISLGMSAASSCFDMLTPTYTIAAMQLVCVSQALDIKKIKLQGQFSKELYNRIRSHVPFVKRDQPLGEAISRLAQSLKDEALSRKDSFLETL